MMDYFDRQNKKMNQNELPSDFKSIKSWLGPSKMAGHDDRIGSSRFLNLFHVEYNKLGWNDRILKTKKVPRTFSGSTMTFCLSRQFEIHISKHKIEEHPSFTSQRQEVSERRIRRVRSLPAIIRNTQTNMVLSTSQVTLKSSQLKAVHRMLAFNEDVDAIEDDFSLPPAGSSHNQWKILIYDKECRSIISPLLSVSQLRRRGVTLHLLLNSEREPIPDVPAVYFCRPTKENLSIIAQDCAKGLYGRCHLNFVTKLDRQLMEDFAKLVVQSGSLETIAGIHDQYLDFVCLEQQLFSLAKKDSYALINGSGVNEQMIEEAMTEIAYGLFSVVATQGKVPIIRCPKVCI